MGEIISFILAFISVFGLYPKTAYIVELDRENELVVAEDAVGLLWSFSDDSGDWAIGDGVSLIFYDNGTQIIYDDVIVSSRYSGFWRN